MRTIFICLLAATVAALAQTNLPLPKVMPGQKTVITSDTALYDSNTRQLVYLGNVLVVDPRIHLTCDRLVVDVPEQGERLSRLSAETNVVVDFADENGAQQQYHVTADNAVYSYGVLNLKTNETVTFSGVPGRLPLVTTKQGTMSAEQIIWDRAAGRIQFRGYHGELPSLTDTNSPSPLKL